MAFSSAAPSSLPHDLLPPVPVTVSAAIACCQEEEAGNYCGVNKPGPGVDMERKDDGGGEKISAAPKAAALVARHSGPTPPDTVVEGAGGQGGRIHAVAVFDVPASYEL